MREMFVRPVGPEVALEDSLITAAEHDDCASPSTRFLSLAFIPDGALAIVFSYAAVADIFAANAVCRSWVMNGNRLDLWKALGETFEVAMPNSLGPSTGGAAGGAGGGKRVLRQVYRLPYMTACVISVACNLKHY